MSDDFVPVIAADVPDKVRRALVSNPGFRVPASTTPPATWLIVARASGMTAGFTLAAAALCGVGAMLLWSIGALIALLIPISGTAQLVFWALVAVAGTLL